MEEAWERSPSPTFASASVLDPVARCVRMVCQDLETAAVPRCPWGVASRTLAHAKVQDGQSLVHSTVVFACSLCVPEIICRSLITQIQRECSERVVILHCLGNNNQKKLHVFSIDAGCFLSIFCLQLFGSVDAETWIWSANCIYSLTHSGILC